MLAGLRMGVERWVVRREKIFEDVWGVRGG